MILKEEDWCYKMLRIYMHVRGEFVSFGVVGLAGMHVGPRMRV
jgi:hypothetical protein